MGSESPITLLRRDVPRAPLFALGEGSHPIKLDQNEAPVDVPDSFKRAVLQAVDRVAWNRYPQPERYAEAKARFATAVGLKPQQLILTAGTDQLILMVLWAATGPGRRARIFEPTYPVYREFGRLVQTEVDPVTLDAGYDVTVRSLGDAVDLLLLARPNNPTGGSAPREVVENALQRPCLTLVDEAYADYAGETVLDLCDDHPNLLIGRSLSKCSLAGVRLGYGVGRPELIEVLEHLVFAPYHLNPLQMEVAAHFELVRDHVDATVAAVVGERERVQSGLGALGVRYWPSRASFVLFAVDDAARVHRRLRDAGVGVRDVSGFPGLGGHLRVTIGERDDNDRFLAALASALGRGDRGGG